MGQINQTKGLGRLFHRYNLLFPYETRLLPNFLLIRVIMITFSSAPPSTRMTFLKHFATKLIQAFKFLDDEKPNMNGAIYSLNYVTNTAACE